SYLLISTPFSPFLYTAPPPPLSFPLSLHDALPILPDAIPTHREPIYTPRPELVSRYPTLPNARQFRMPNMGFDVQKAIFGMRNRSEEHTSELQSPYDLVCRLLLEKKKK